MLAGHIGDGVGVRKGNVEGRGTRQALAAGGTAAGPDGARRRRQGDEAEADRLVQQGGDTVGRGQSKRGVHTDQFDAGVHAVGRSLVGQGELNGAGLVHQPGTCAAGKVALVATGLARDGRGWRGARKSIAARVDAGIGVGVSRRDGASADVAPGEAVALPFGKASRDGGVVRLPVAARAGHEDIVARGSALDWQAQGDRFQERGVVWCEFVGAIDRHGALGGRSRCTTRRARDADGDGAGQGAGRNDHLRTIRPGDGAASRPDPHADLRLCGLRITPATAGEPEREREAGQQPDQRAEPGPHRPGFVGCVAFPGGQLDGAARIEVHLVLQGWVQGVCDRYLKLQVRPRPFQCRKS
jgi:hypothetical protein